MTSLVVAAFLCPFYRRSVQLDLRWFPGKSGCDLVVPWMWSGRGAQRYLLHPARKPGVALDPRLIRGQAQVVQRPGRPDMTRLVPRSMLTHAVLMSPRPKRRMLGRGGGVSRWSTSKINTAPVSVIRGPLMLMLPGFLLKMQNPGLTPVSLNQSSRGKGPWLLYVHKSFS